MIRIVYKNEVEEKAFKTDNKVVIGFKNNELVVFDLTKFNTVLRLNLAEYEVNIFYDFD